MFADKNVFCSRCCLLLKNQWSNINYQQQQHRLFCNHLSGNDDILVIACIVSVVIVLIVVVVIAFIDIAVITVYIIVFVAVAVVTKVGGWLLVIG